MLDATVSYKPVYDILNAGPRHRFVVLGKGGPFIVHNCIQAMCRDLLRDGWIALDKAGFKVLFTAHDEIIMEVPKEGVAESVKEIERILRDVPAWAASIPVDVETAVHWHYKK